MADPDEALIEAIAGAISDKIPQLDWCLDCEQVQVIEDEWDDQEGFEEQARDVHVIALACGHSISYPIARRRCEP